MSHPRAALILALASTPLGCGAVTANPTSNPVTPATEPAFDPARVETVDGRVMGADETPSEQQLDRNVRVKVNSAAGPVVVHLGPGWYLDEKGLRYEPEQTVVVKGSKVKHRGEEVIIATEVQQGELLVPLRDPEGHPVWKTKQIEDEESD